jgi:hypothetical protein
VDATFAAFGIDAVYMPAGGEPVRVRVIARRPDTIVGFGETRIHTETATFEVRASEIAIVLDEHLVRDAERARTELDTLAQVVSANLTRAALEAAPVVADLSSWLAEVAGKAGIAWERLFETPEDKSLRTLRYELDLTESTIAKLQGRIDELRKSPTLGFTTFIDTAQIGALQKKVDELSRVRGQTQARIAFLEGPPEQPWVVPHAPSCAR